MRLVVCPRRHVGEVAGEHRPSHAVGFVSPGDIAPSLPAEIAHLVLALHDIDGPRAGLVPAAEADMAALLAFGRGWDGARPLLVHCEMGISRSTAAALALACQARPDRSEERLAIALRQAAPCATPNARLVSLADGMLGREGRLIAAAGRIGRGADYAPYRAFTLDLGRGCAPAPASGRAAQ